MCTIFVFGSGDDVRADEDYDTLVSKDAAPRLADVNEFDRTVIANGFDKLMTLMPVLNIQTLWCAAEEGDLRMVQRCLDSGIDVNFQDETDNYSALLMAAEAGHLKVIKALHAASANVEARDAFGRTPVYAAAVAGNVEVVKYLVLEYGADREAMDDDERTPFWSACATRQVETARALFDLGVRVDHRDNTGQSPFEFASASGHADVISFLRFDCGYVPQRVSRFGSPIDGCAPANTSDTKSFLGDLHGAQRTCK